MTAGPWDKYAAAAPAGGPWAKYAAPTTAPAFTESTDDLRPGSRDVAADPFAGENWGDTLSRTPQSFASGAVGGISALPEGLAVLGQQNEVSQKKGITQQLPMADMEIERIRRNLADPKLDAQSKAELNDELKILLQGREDMVAGAASPTMAAKDTDFYKVGAKIRAAGASAIGSPDYRDQTMTNRLAGGAGAIVGLGLAAVPGLIAGPSGMLALGAAEGAAATTSGIYADAIRSGATEEDAQQAAMWGLPIGVLTSLPMLKGLGQIGGKLGEKVASEFAKKIGRIALDSGTAAAIFAGGTAMQNLVAKGYYDPERGLADGVGESVLLGALIGGIPSAYHQARSGRTQPAGAVSEADVQTAPIAADATAALSPKAEVAVPTAVAEAVPADVQAAIAPKSNADKTREALAGVGVKVPEAAPKAPEAAPEAPVTSEGNPPPEAPPAASGPEASGDTIPPVPESPVTIAEQTKALLDPKNPRKAVYLPYGADDPAPAGRNIKGIALEGGMLYFDSKSIGEKSIQILVKNGQLGKVLGLGDITKADAAKSMAEGNAPVAVTERTPDGTEVKAAAGTTETAPEQIASLEASKTPGNLVAAEPAGQVLQDRISNTEAISKPAAEPTSPLPPPPDERAPVTQSVQEQAAEVKARKRAELDVAKSAIEARDVAAKKAIAEAAAREEGNFGASEGRKIDPKTLSPEEKARIEALVGKPAQKPVVQPTERTAEIDEPPAAKKAKAVSKSRSPVTRKAKVWKPGDDAKAETRKQTIDKANRGEFPSVAEEAKARRASVTHDAGRENASIDNAVKSDQLKKDMVPDRPEVVRNLAGASKVYERLWKTIEEAKKRKINTISKIDAAHTNSQAWLAQVRTMALKLRSLHEKNSSTQKVILDALSSFLSDEHIYAKDGDASGLRATRLEEGARASPSGGPGKGTGDVYVADTDAVPVEAKVDTRAEEEALAEGVPLEQSAENDEVASLGNEDGDVRMFDPTELKGGEPIPRPVAKEGEVFKAEDAAPVKTAPVEKVTSKGKLTPEQIREKMKAIKAARTDGDAPLARRLIVDLRGNYRMEIKATEADTSLGGVDYMHDFTPPEEILADAKGDTSTIEAFASQITTALEKGALRLRGTSPLRDALQSKIVGPMLKEIVRLTKGVKVHFLEEGDYEPFGGSSYGYYSPAGDYIVIRHGLPMHERVATLVHEAAHAAFWHVLRGNDEVRAQVRQLMERARDHAANVGWHTSDPNGMHYGFTNEGEFLSEAWGNPEFQEFLDTVPLDGKSRAMVDGVLPNISSRIRFAMQALKLIVSKALRAGEWKRMTSMDGVLAISGQIIDLAPFARDRYYADIAQRVKDAGSVMLPKQADKLTHEQELVVRGLTREQAKDAAEVLKEVLGDKVTSEHFDAIAKAFETPISEGTPFNGEGLPPEVTEAMNAADEPGVPATNKHATALRKIRLGLMTADHIVRVFAKHFKDGGVALEAWHNAIERAEPIAKKIADVHDEDAAHWMDLRKKNPKAAAAAATLVEELSPFDLDIRPGATNKHLSKNGKADYQAKFHLPALKAAFAALPEDVQALLSRMSDHYRDTHNKLATEVTKTIMEGIKAPLTASQRADILDRTLKGNLDEADKLLIGDDAIFETLDNAREVRTRNGMFFPAQRFGDWVVTSKQKIALPDFKEVITKQSGIKVPVKVAQDGNSVQLIIDSSVRGAHAALLRSAKSYVETHELTQTSYRLKYKDKVTGKVVYKNEQDVSHPHDLVHEITFQDDGVHMFERNRDARTFYDNAQADLKTGVITEVSLVGERHEHGQLGKIMNNTAMGAVLRALDARLKANDITKTQHSQMTSVLTDAITMNMPGNRYEKRLLKRRNILGQSEDLGRAANAYGRAAGNYMGQTMMGPARRAALEAMMKMGHDGIPSQVLNQIERLEMSIGGPQKNSQIIDDIVGISSWKRLFSPAGWGVNASQVLMNTYPVLAGRYGTIKAGAAITSAYNRMGILEMVGQGLKNTGKAITLAGNHVLDTTNTVQSARANLGPKYHALIDHMLELGILSNDVGIENVGAMGARKSWRGKAIVKVDRITRQMPAVIEAVNRIGSAVSTYDLALEHGVTPAKAEKLAIDTTRLTQGDYRQSNAPNFMKIRALRFTLVFRKYGQLQYQLIGDMTRRAFTDASLAERKVAFHQIKHLMLTNALVGGILVVPASEAIKGIVMVLNQFGLSDSWDEVEHDFREMMKGLVGDTAEQMIDKGALSVATGIDFGSRVGWQDLITGFPPRDNSTDERMKFVANFMLGSPGGMLNEGVQALQAVGKMAKAVRAGMPEEAKKQLAKALALAAPIKVFGDTVKAVSGYMAGKLSGVDAAKQSFGFRSLKQAEIGDEVGASIRASKAKKDEVNTLIGNYLSAIDPADVAEAKRAIQAYNRKVPKGQRPISLSAGLEKKRLDNAAMYE